MVYDGDGNRVSETVGSTTTKYLVDTLNPTGYSQVLDELVSGAVTKTYTYGLQRISDNQLSGSTWTPTFYGYDGHGNVRFTTSTAGAVGNTYQFDAFGAPIASTGTIANTYLYSGERFDSNLNLYQLRARFYNMLTGRFETMDPYAGKISDPATLHNYVYTRNNPANRVDPAGKDDIEEYVWVAAEQFHHVNFARGIGSCTAGGLGLGAAGLDSAASGSSSSNEAAGDFPSCIPEALWDLFYPPPGIPIVPYPGQ
jgi:RHS repeat-associated protein